MRIEVGDRCEVLFYGNWFYCLRSCLIVLEPKKLVAILVIKVDNAVILESSMKAKLHGSRLTDLRTNKKAKQLFYI
jgi:hypothetical protein